ncbi:MAG TPA: GNAT family N-acetyltransferase [Stellaceae bacterium]|jgi:GNAT superfamily N-acetyltransferase|nr:GNAT family N-acetyltransferase [Stellaceae bacterium]
MAAAKPRAKPAKRLTYAVTGASRNAARKTILNGLKAFNKEVTGPQHWKSFAVVVNNGAGQVQGGLSGWMGWGWMYIELFWLPEALRRQGHGSKLMELAEAEAKRRGCVGMYLNTASFQAPKFYPKLGFKVFAVVDDFPPGHKNYYLIKRFTG